MRRYRLILTLASVLASLPVLASGLARAQDASAPAPAVITIDDAYRLALRNYEAVGIATEGISQAESNLDKALSRMLPRLTADGTYTQYNKQQKSGALVIQPDDSSAVNVKLTQSLYSGGTEWSARRQAKMYVEKSKVGLSYTNQSVMLNTARAYYTVLKAQKDVEIKTAALKRAEERMKVAAARLKVGEVTKSVLLRAQAESARAEAELTKSRSSLNDARTFFKRLLRIDGEFTITEPPFAPDDTPSVDTLINTAYSKRLDYRQSVLDTEIAKEGIVYARGNFLPSLRIEGLYAWKDQNPQTTFFQRESVSGSVVLSYPIFEGGLRKAEYDEAGSRLREAELRRYALKRDIDVDVRQVYNEKESVKALMDSYRKQLSFAEEDYKMVFEQFKYGLATSVDVIDADSSLISAQSSYVNATYDMQLSLIALKYAVGLLPQGPRD